MRVHPPTPLAVSLASLLLKSPGLTQTQIHIALAHRGEFLSRRVVNHTLYGNRSLFARQGPGRPRWFFVGHVPAAPQPRSWQTRALTQWRDAGRRGVVEAPSGAGKTLIGVQAIREAVVRGRKCLVVVPGLEALTHWRDALRRYAPGLRIGLASGRESGQLCRNHVVVATAQSGYVFPLHSERRKGLLVLDNLHHLSPDLLAHALDDRFAERLGLTTALGREVTTLAHLVPYFTPHGRPLTRQGAVVMTYGYAEALADEVLMPWRVGFVGVRLATHERVEYEAIDRIVRDARAALVEVCELPAAGGAEFARAVHLLSENTAGESRAHWLARRYLAAVAKRRTLLAESPRKMAALEKVLPLIQRARGTLLFGESADSAEMAALELALCGLSAAALSPALDDDARRDLLMQYRHEQIRALTLAQDAEIGDLPSAELGIFVSAARNRRHLLERMGCVIRPHRGDIQATFLVFYFVNTVEDPEAYNGDEATSGLPTVLLAAAQSVQVFGPYASAEALVTWRGRPLATSAPATTMRA